MEKGIPSRILTEAEQKRFRQVFEREQVLPIVHAFNVLGGTVFCVGGAVRDLLLQLPIKDLDFEIHGLTEEIIVGVLSKFGTVAKQGRSFGVLRLNPWNIDWSLPRTDGPGRRPDVVIDPAMGLVGALRRRDLTMNALALDVATYTLFDPFEGEKDLQQHVLRAVSAETFVEDPLRLYRVMQFLARFDMSPDEELSQICAHMDVSLVSRERLEGEINKLFLLSSRPSEGFRWLEKIGQLSRIFPELSMLRGVQQSPIWHPEGDVFEHTMQVLDAVAQHNKSLSTAEYFGLCYAALCHDMGKVATTRLHPHDGRLISYGHEEVGLEYARVFLARITEHKQLVSRVLRLVRYHMRPCALVRGRAGCAAYRRLAAHMAPDSLSYLSCIAHADMRGRNGANTDPLDASIVCVEEFVEKARECGVLERALAPILSGSDLIVRGVAGPQIGVLLKRAYEYQIATGTQEPEVLLSYLGFK